MTFSVMTVPSTVAYYISYETLRDSLSPRLETYGLDAYAPLLSGSISRCKNLWIMPKTHSNWLPVGVAIVSSPVELLKTRMQSGEAEHSTLSKALSGVRTLIRENGFLSLWRGIGPTLLRDVPFSGKMSLIIQKNGH